MTNSALYPLSVGNKWIYQSKDGNTFSNEVTNQDGDKFTMVNSLLNIDQFVQKDGDQYLADNFEAGNFQVFLKENIKVGDTWEINYKANNFDNILFMTVKEVDASQEIYGNSYNDVVMIEGELKMNINGTLTAINHFTQYYYAKGIGLVLTTSSIGDYMGLISHELN